MTVVVIIEGLAIALLALLVLGLLRSHAEILRALHDLGISLDPDGDGTHERRHHPTRRSDATDAATGERGGASVGRTLLDLDGIDPLGRSTHIAVTGVDRLTLVAFLSSGCSSLPRLLGALRRPGNGHPRERAWSWSPRALESEQRGGARSGYRLLRRR